MVETEELDFDARTEGIPYLYTGPTASRQTLKRAIRRTEQELFSWVDAWSAADYDDYEWLVGEVRGGKFDWFQEEERIAERLSYLRALELHMVERTKNGTRS